MATACVREPVVREDASSSKTGCRSIPQSGAFPGRHGRIGRMHGVAIEEDAPRGRVPIYDRLTDRSRHPEQPDSNRADDDRRQPVIPHGCSPSEPASRLWQQAIRRLRPPIPPDKHLSVGDQRYAELSGEVEGIARRHLVAAVENRDQAASYAASSTPGAAEPQVNSTPQSPLR